MWFHKHAIRGIKSVLILMELDTDDKDRRLLE